jgi:phage shock protein PspC (stress-responsive transcriptional regulator)
MNFNQKNKDMKKIININLSGRVIPIEDSAYENLKAYIESLRRYFANEESREEIINDIESRIAELMSEKVRKGATCITDADVEEIITSMGRPEDFDADDSLDSKASSSASSSASAASSSQQGQQKQESSSSSEKKSTRVKTRLYRDTNDKFLGGVCSGIAVYLNVDPSIVRILFAIITFGGFGLGFLAYIILWMVLPPKDLEGSLGKKLYRNPDDRVIAGVAGGLAAYFNSKATTIRLIFAAPILLSILFGIINTDAWHNDFILVPNIVFGSLTGTFILAYVILWMVLPEAHSTYEKMEMRGEKVDVNTIRQNVKESAENFKERAKEWGEEVKESAQQFGERAKEFANTRGKTFANEFGETARRGGNRLGHAIGVLFKAFFLFIFGVIAVSIFIGLIALLFSGVFWWPINNFLWTSNSQQVYAWGTLIFFFVVPLIAFITWLIRRILRVKSRSNYLGWTFGFLWTIGWVAASLLGVSISKDFREYEQAKPFVVEMSQPQNNKLIVAVSEPELQYTGRFDWMNDESEGWDLTDDTLKLSTLKISPRLSPDSLYHVIVRKHSYGKTEDEASLRAERIVYAVSSRDSVLDLANGYAIGKENKFRGQQVEIEIQIPRGRKIRFDESVHRKLNLTDLRIRTVRVNGVVTERHRIYSTGIRSGVDYIMGIDGELTFADGKPLIDDNYRYRDGNENSDSIRIQEELREQKRIRDDRERERQESERKIKELEEKQKQLKPTTFKKEPTNEKTEEIAIGSPSLVVSPMSLIN